MFSGIVWDGIPRTVHPSRNFPFETSNCIVDTPSPPYSASGQLFRLTVGILQEMARWENDPELDDLAQWTEAGGDPNFAFQYVLERIEQDQKSNQNAVASSDTGLPPPR